MRGTVLCCSCICAVHERMLHNVQAPASINVLPLAFVVQNSSAELLLTAAVM